MTLSCPVTMAAIAGPRLVRLAPVDLVIVVFYFVLVLAIGFYLKGRANTGEDFFLAGREISRVDRGPQLSFGEPRRARTHGLGRVRLSIWNSGGSLVLDWRNSRDAISRHRDDAFHYISKTHSVPGYLKLRFGEPSRVLSAVTFAFMTVLMSGINMYSMALVMKVVLGWDINFSIWVSSITVAVYVTLGGLRSAIFNEVLQFILIWAGALLIPILGLIEVGGWRELQAQCDAQRVGGVVRTCGPPLGSFSR